VKKTPKGFNENSMRGNKKGVEIYGNSTPEKTPENEYKAGFCLDLKPEPIYPNHIVFNFIS
jgi:hypothetical protein